MPRDHVVRCCIALIVIGLLVLACAFQEIP